MHIALTRTLREMAVDYIREHRTDVRFRTLLKLRIRNEFPNLLRRHTSQRVPAFLDILRTDRVWGASESLLALSSIFECDIIVYRENGFCTTVTNEQATHRNSIAVVFRGQASLWNHYDSFLEFINQPSSAPMNTERTNVLWSTVNFTSGSCLALRTLPDGNCMFSAIANQLFGIDMESPSRNEAISQLRKQAISFLRSHMHEHRIRQLLANRFEHSFPRIPPPFNDIHCNMLLDHLAQCNVWGGTECLTAIAEYYQCTIRTIWENGAITQIRPTNPNTVDMISIVYRQINQQWNHYDSFMCFVQPPADDRRTTNADSLATSQKQPIIISDDDEPIMSGTGNGISTQCPGTIPTKPTIITSANDIWPFIKIGTWNVRGCNSVEKRFAIDKFLAMQQFGIVALQETKLSARTCDTKHYKWILGMDWTLLMQGILDDSLS